MIECTCEGRALNPDNWNPNCPIDGHRDMTNKVKQQHILRTTKRSIAEWEEYKDESRVLEFDGYTAD